MKMNLINSIKDSNRVLFCEDGFLIAFKKDLKFHGFNFDLIWDMFLPGTIGHLFFIKNILFIEYFSPETGFEQTYFYDYMKNKKVASIINDYLVRAFTSNNFAFANKYDKDYNVTTALLDLNNQKIIWEKPNMKLPFIYNDIPIYAIKNEVIRFNFEGKTLWTYDTTTLGTWIDYDKREQETAVRRVIGELDGRLYIYLNSGKILVLDVETGDILKKLVNDKYVSEHWFNGNFGYFIEIDRQNKKLIQLAQKSYTEVNLATYEVTQIDLKESMPINLENDHNIVFDETHIYFSDRYNCKLASLNRTTMQIDWVHQLSDPKTCEIDGNRHGKDLKLYGNRLYVLDNKSTLHIFEKENV
jgi:outer membrane protein assembly factor BamB